MRFSGQRMFDHPAVDWYRFEMKKLSKMAASDLRRIEAEPHSMDRLQVDLWICFEIFSQFGDEYIHTPAQEIVVFAPDIQ